MDQKEMEWKVEKVKKIGRNRYSGVACIFWSLTYEDHGK